MGQQFLILWSLLRTEQRICCGILQTACKLGLFIGQRVPVGNCSPETKPSCRTGINRTPSNPQYTKLSTQELRQKAAFSPDKCLRKFIQKTYHKDCHLHFLVFGGDGTCFALVLDRHKLSSWVLHFYRLLKNSSELFRSKIVPVS